MRGLVGALGLGIMFGVSTYVGVAQYYKPSTPAGEHVSMYFYDNKDFFAASLKPFIHESALRSAPRIFVTNQHILAASLIAHQFALAADPSVRRVFLITQNNWTAGEAKVITSFARWKTPLGDLEPDLAAAHALVSANVATQDESIFAREHGITGIIPYVAYAFPNARVVPLVIRDKTTDAEIEVLAREILVLQDVNTVVVGTIDMSHYLPKPIADAHDRRTLEAIDTADYPVLSRLDIDTAPTLRVVLKIAEGRGEQTFIKTGAANSSDITGDLALTSTTGYLTGYFTKGRPNGSDGVHVLFAGDVMLDRNVARVATTSSPVALLQGVERLFLGADLNVVNLEGTVTTNSSIAQKNSKILRFTFDPALVGKVLPQNHIDMVSLANNHSLDFGVAGYEETLQHLQTLGIKAFGHPYNVASNLSASADVRGKRICFVGYMALFMPDTASTMAEIGRLRPDCWRVVAFSHWGEEYFDVPTALQREQAHAFVDAGADLVVGSHPHVVEPVEIYQGKAIFYSMGNFVFDQNFSWETTHGIAVHVEFEDAQTRFTVFPTEVYDGVVTPAGADDAQKTLKRLVDKALAPALAHDILTTSGFLLPN